MTTPQIINRPSPNYWLLSSPVKAVVLHGTSGPFNASIGWLCNPSSNASANYLIDLDGTIYCLVDPYQGKRAWANGIISEPDRSIGWLMDCLKSGDNPNNCTISIEHVASGTAMIAGDITAMPAAQLSASLWLTSKLLKDFNLTPNAQSVIGHCQIDGISRAHCPGVINIPDYIKRLQSMSYNPNPDNLSIGQGVLDAMTRMADIAVTREQYYSPDGSEPGPGLEKRSMTWGRKYFYLAIQRYGQDGKPAGPWDVQVYRQ